MKNVKKNVNYKNSGFTLIELLAVIIILGILMIIAIPSVTSYINNSRKSAYVDTAKELVSGARTFVNEGKVEMYDAGTTYYIDYGCVKTENTSKSPYGDFTNAYIVVTYDGKGYNYYWISRDETGQGVKTIVKSDELDEDDIVSDIGVDEVQPTTTLGERTTVTLINSNCEKTEGTVLKHASETGETIFTLTYNNQDGTGCTTKTGNYMEEWGELCTPTRDDDYSFQGWYTQPNGQGNKITATSKVNGHITGYAYWKNPTAAEQILETALAADQLNQIPGTEIYIFKGGTTNPPANYVKFNNEIWRIVGIYTDKLKIIRVNSTTGIPSAPIGFTYIEFNSIKPNPGWANSSLKESLNSTYYNTLNDTTKRMIDENGSWNVGPVSENAIAKEAYTSATITGTVGNTTHTTPWIGKVGLLASYEFLYASGGDNCLTTTGNIYSVVGDCGKATNNWLLYNGNISWTLSPDSAYEFSSLKVHSYGYISGNSVTDSCAAVPVVFLKSNVKVVSGDGKSTSTAYVLQ